MMDRGHDDLLSKLRIPDYQLLKHIGEGSYGDIWLARSVTGQYRAVKVVFEGKPEDHHLFDREFLGVQKYEPISRNHPGLLHILHVGINKEEGYFYYVMELADDCERKREIDPATYVPASLEHRWNVQKRLPVDECLQLGIDLASALDYLHQSGRIHRDIKLPNILLVDGAPKLADVGLVAGIAGSHSFVGTEGYVPHEGPGTPSADIYGLGKILYEISTGMDRLKFPDLPPDWDVLAADKRMVGLNDIILRACHPVPAKRFKDARHLHDTLLLLKSRPPGNRREAIRLSLRRIFSPSPKGGTPAQRRREGGARRLPVYFLLDGSGSMRGPSLDAGKRVIHHTLELLNQRHHPTRTPIVTTVICFRRDAIQLAPLLPVNEFSVHTTGLAGIRPAGISLLGSALTALESSIDHELTHPGLSNGDAEPIVALLTDGECCDSDHCHEMLARLKEPHATFVVIGLSPHAAKAKEKLGRFAYYLDHDQMAMLEQIVDRRWQSLEQAQHPILYPAGYQPERRRVPY